MMELYKNIIFKHEMETKIGRKKKPSQIRRRAVVRLSSLRLNKQAQSSLWPTPVATLTLTAWRSSQLELGFQQPLTSNVGTLLLAASVPPPSKKKKKKQLTNDLKKGNDTNFAQIKKYKHKTTRPSGFLYKTFYK